MSYDVFFENVSPGNSESGVNDDIEENLQVVQNSSLGYSILRTDLLEGLRRGHIEEFNDLDAALNLLELCHKELIAYATVRNNQLTETDIMLALRSLRMTLFRLGIDTNLPFRNFTTFQDFWIEQGAVGDGSWRRRRALLESTFASIRAALDSLEEHRLTKPLSKPINEHGPSWPEVDTEVRELRRKFNMAVTPQDFRALGTNFIGVLEAVGDAVYSPTEDLRGDERGIPRDKPRVRIERFLERKIISEHRTLQEQTSATVALAHRVKHLQSPNALMTGVAADSTILLVSIIRRIADPEFELTLSDEVPF